MTPPRPPQYASRRLKARKSLDIVARSCRACPRLPPAYGVHVLRDHRCRRPAEPQGAREVNRHDIAHGVRHMRPYALQSQRDERASNFAALASAFAVAAANLAAAFCSAAMARSSAFCAVATFFVAAAWAFVKVATGFRTPRFALFLAAALRGPFFAAALRATFLAARFFGTIAISISNLAAFLSSAVTNSESISAS